VSTELVAIQCTHGVRSAWFWDWWKNKKIVQVFR
jgi:hypothetical protein